MKQGREKGANAIDIPEDIYFTLKNAQDGQFKPGVGASRRVAISLNSPDQKISHRRLP